MNNKRTILTAGIIFALCLSVNIFRTWDIAVNSFKTNNLDKLYALDVQRGIENYERKSGNEIKNIAVAHDEAVRYSYDGIKYVYKDTNIKSMVVSWGDVATINYYTNENFTKIDMDDKVFEEQFKGKNWDRFVENEQMFFEGDTLYLCIY
ncbi:hypothetical protein OfM2_15360 [Lactovum odontotermitis]